MPLYKDVRPTDLSGVIGQEVAIGELRQMLARCRATGDRLPDMLFTGPPGVGKTSVALAIAAEWFGPDWRQSFYEMNASDERGIDVVRTKIKPIAQTRGQRILLLDEADRLTDEAQDGLRRIIENSKDTIFILTCNKSYLISDAIKSRCVPFYFRPLTQKEISRVIINVCKTKGINFEASSAEEQRQLREGLEVLVKESGGDVRMALNILERVLTEHKTITAKDVIKYVQPNLVPKIVRSFIAGDWDTGYKELTDCIHLSKYNTSEIVERFMDAINTEVQDKERRAFLLIKLSDVESRLRLGSTPIVQFSAFAGYLYVSPHLSGVIGIQQQ